MYFHKDSDIELQSDGINDDFELFIKKNNENSINIQEYFENTDFQQVYNFFYQIMFKLKNENAIWFYN